MIPPLFLSSSRILLVLSVAVVQLSVAQFPSNPDRPPSPLLASGLPSKPQRNTLRHGLSKLNSSVSFGINESEIAAIFRGVAYGVTSHPQVTQKIEDITTTTSTAATTSTSTTSTTTTSDALSVSITHSPLSAVKVNDEMQKDIADVDPLSANVPYSWDRSTQNRPRNDSLYSSAEKTYFPRPFDGQQPFIETQDLRNNILEDYNTESAYKPSDSLIVLREGLENSYIERKFDSSDGPKNDGKDIEMHQVVDYAWVIHVYLTGVLMGVVAAMAICCISRIHFCSPIFPRTFFVTMHILVFLAASLRCILLFNGSFGEANSKLPKVLTGLLINSVPPCLTAAFALVLLVFLQATHLHIVPSKYQSSFVLALISIVHIVSSIVVDICAGLSDSQSVINALRAGVQAATAGWGVILCLGFIFLIVHLWKNEEIRAAIPKKSLQVIYVAVAVEMILACFTIYGIVTPRVTTTKENDNTWSLWVMASVERLLEACFCVTLLVITTTFTLSKCNGPKPQEQKVFSVMSTGKREGGLRRSANVYPVTSDKGGFLGNTIFGGNLDNDNAAKSENYYSGWLDKYAGTIDSTTSDFQLLGGKCTSTMSTVLYPPFSTGDSGDDSAKESYITHGGQESSATSYSTLSSYKQVNRGHLCYCAPVTSCCPSQHQHTLGGIQGFKKPVLLVPQYSHPQIPRSALQSEESSSGSSYYGSSLGSSHIYSSPQYYTCHNQVGVADVMSDVHQQLPVHLHQCSETTKAIHTSVSTRNAEARHLPSASLPILQDIPENSKRVLQYRPQQPLPSQQELQRITDVHHLQPRTSGAKTNQHLHQHAIHHPHPHLLHQHIHPQHQQLSRPLSSTPTILEVPSSSPPLLDIQDTTASKDKTCRSNSTEDSSVVKDSVNSFVNTVTSAQIDSSHRDGDEPITCSSSKGIEKTIEVSDCSFLNKLVRSPEGQVLGSSLELDTKRTSSRRMPFVNRASGVPGASYRQHMALDDADLPSQIV